MIFITLKMLCRLIPRNMIYSIVAFCSWCFLATIISSEVLCQLLKTISLSPCFYVPLFSKFRADKDDLLIIKWQNSIAQSKGMRGNMKIHKNPNCKKVRGSHVLEVSCAHCKCFIAKYQKVGESNFVKMYNERIIEGAIDFSLYHGAIFCPNCGERIATRYITKMDKKEAYRFVPSAFNKKKLVL